jgi:Amidase
LVSKRIGQNIRRLKKYTREDIDRIYRLKEKFDNEFTERWQAEKLDAMICPPYYHAAFKVNADKNELALQADYTLFWNVLHYPAGIVPVTEVMKGEDQVYEDGINDLITKKCRDSVKDSAGLPIGVQVAAPRWKDEECLAVMKILEELVNFKKEPNFEQLEKASNAFQRLPFEEGSWSLIKILMLILQAALYIFAGYMHFVNEKFYEKIMPKWIPYHHEMIVLSGIAEIAGGVGLLIP